MRRRNFAHVVVLATSVRYAAAQIPTGWPVYPQTFFGTTSLPGNSSYPLNGWGITNAQLLTSSDGQCNYMEQQFMDQFTSTTLNLTKWLPTGSVAPPPNAKQQSRSDPTLYAPTPWGPTAFGAYQNHCPSAGAVGAAGPSSCTLMDPNQLQPGFNYPDGGIGLRMSLAQQPCYFANGTNNPYCCQTQAIAKKVNGITQTFSVPVCASWSGTHLSSAFCAQYGVFEVEARFNIPANNGAYVFFGSYQFGCNGPDGSNYNGGTPMAPNCDPTWNEIGA